MKKREAIASIGITNTTALIITDIDEAGESVTYCVSVVDEEQAPKSHHAKINYTIKDGEPYFNSILGRMHLSEAMRVTPFAI
jgi:hypoxanthine phosphoribosyltransferase